jgi:hypothetical protein
MVTTYFFTWNLKEASISGKAFDMTEKFQSFVWSILQGVVDTCIYVVAGSSVNAAVPAHNFKNNCLR